MVETKRKLIRYIKPIKNESLLSFLNRLSIVNRISFSVLLRFIGYNHHIINNKYIINTQDYNEAIDNYINVAIVSNNRLDDIYKTSLENALNWTISSEYQALSHLLRVENKRFTKFCPLCLKEQSIHKLYWQYEGMVFCEEHGTKLLNKCTYCNNKAHVEDIIIDRCRKCGNSFSQSETSNKQYEIEYYREFVKEISARSTLNRSNELSLSVKRYAFCVKFIISNYEIIKESIRLNQDFYTLLENELSDEKLIRLIELFLKDQGELIFQVIMHVAMNSKLNQTGDLLSYGNKIIHYKTINDQSVIFTLLDVNYEQLKLFGILNDERLDEYNYCFAKAANIRDKKKDNKKKIQNNNFMQMRNKHYSEVAKFRFKVIEPLLSSDSDRSATGARVKEVNDIINSGNEVMIKQYFSSNFYSTISRSTIGRWVGRYINSKGDINSLIPNYHNSGGRGKIRFDKRIIKYIYDAMESKTDYSNERTKRVIYQEVSNQVKEYNITADQPIIMPYLITISNYIDRIV